MSEKKQISLKRWHNFRHEWLWLILTLISVTNVVQCFCRDQPLTAEKAVAKSRVGTLRLLLYMGTVVGFPVALLQHSTVPIATRGRGRGVRGKGENFN